MRAYDQLVALWPLFYQAVARAMHFGTDPLEELKASMDAAEARVILAEWRKFRK